MRADDLILVSVDDHAVEPADLFEQHLAAEFRSEAPRIVRKKDGTDVWVYQGSQIPNIGLNAVVGRPPEKYGMEPTSFDQRPRERSTVAALRAEAPDVDLSLKSQGGKAPSNDPLRPVSTQDVTSQLATAFMTPAE
jgi:hypothetical protein